MVSGKSNELTHVETCNSNIKADEKTARVYFPLTARERRMRDESKPFPIDCLHDGERRHLCTAAGSIGDTLRTAGRQCLHHRAFANDSHQCVAPPFAQRCSGLRIALLESDHERRVAARVDVVWVGTQYDQLRQVSMLYRGSGRAQGGHPVLVVFMPKTY
jgi:hypothetical protein